MNTKNYILAFFMSFLIGMTTTFAIKVAVQYKQDKKIEPPGYYGGFVPISASISDFIDHANDDGTVKQLVAIYNIRRPHFLPEIGLYMMAAKNTLHYEINKTDFDRMMEADTLSVLDEFFEKE